MAASTLITERMPRPGSWTKKGTCFTQGSQVESRLSSAVFAFHQLFQRLVEAEILLYTEFLGSRKVKCKPPLALVSSKRLAWGQRQIVTVQNPVKTVSRLGALLNKSLAMSDQSTQFPNGMRR